MKYSKTILPFYYSFFGIREPSHTAQKCCDNDLMNLISGLILVSVETHLRIKHLGRKFKLFRKKWIPSEKCEWELFSVWYKRYFCKQIEKQNNFIIGIVMAHSARDFISGEFETILE